ncbi:hypothetical protein TSAR_003546, partial [Trichomalopsis sarcophagae]
FEFPVHNIEQYDNPLKLSFKCVTVYTNYNPSYKTTCALHNVKLMKLFYQHKL